VVLVFQQAAEVEQLQVALQLTQQVAQVVEDLLAVEAVLHF
jgi:hypothetical protein